MKTTTKKPCPERVEAIAALASGLEPDPTLREHLLECPGCNAHFRRQRRFDDLLTETAGALEDPWLAARPRRQRVSAWRIAAVAGTAAAVVAIVVATAMVVDQRLPRAARPASVAPRVAGAPAGTGLEQPPQAPAADRDQAQVIEEIHLSTTADEHVVRSFRDGLRLSLSGEGEAVVQRTGRRSYRVELHSGLLVGDVPTSTPLTHVVVVARNMQVRVKGTLFSVMAREGRITSVEVERGAVEVENRLTRETMQLEAGQKLDIESVTVARRDEGSPSMLLSFLVEIPIEDEKSGQPHKPARTQAKRTSQTHAPTAYEHAMALRKEGRYEEAVEAFLDAASQSTGLTQQRCYYHAASLSLSQLDDPQRTIMLTSSYEAKFPGGIFAEEVDLLQARAHLEAREPEKARAVLVDYIEHYPDGTHEALAHLLLGKIFATTYGNCKSAQTHLLYVEQSEPDSTWATQARKILDFCAKKKATNH